MLISVLATQIDCHTTLLAKKVTLNHSVGSDFTFKRAAQHKKENKATARHKGSLQTVRRLAFQPQPYSTSHQVQLGHWKNKAIKLILSPTLAPITVRTWHKTQTRELDSKSSRDVRR